MRFKHKITSVGLIVIVFCVLAISQAGAQSPTATPAPEATADDVTPVPSPTTTPLIATVFSSRQAVVKRPTDGDSVEVVFTDDGQIATIHLANVDAPESIKDVECFGRESSEFAAQAYQDNPLISIKLAGEIQEGEAVGYIKLANGTLLNELVVLFGYARYDDQIQSEFMLQIKEAEEQSKQGRTGLWRTCGETEKPPKPCYFFNDREMDSVSKRAIFAQFSDVTEVNASFIHAFYDQVQHEIIVAWDVRLDGEWGWRMDEYYRLSDCLRDRSEVYVDD